MGRRVLVALAPLAGCVVPPWGLDGEPVDDDTASERETDSVLDTDTDVVSLQDPEVTRVSPVWAVNTGGSTITIDVSNAPAESEWEVWFGSTPASLTDEQPGQLFVDVPTTDQAGRVDLQVTHGELGPIYTGDFVLYDDLAGASGAFGAVEILTDYGSASLAITSAGDDRTWLDVMSVPDTIGSCATNTVLPDDIATSLPSESLFSTPGLRVAGIDLEPVTVSGYDGFYSGGASGVAFAGQLVRLTRGGSATFPPDASTEANLTRVPANAPTVTSPVLTSSGTVPQSFRVDYAADGPVVVLRVLRRSGLYPVTLSCRLDPAGSSFVVPTEQLGGWSSGDEIWVSVGNAYVPAPGDPTFALPWNNGTSGVVGIHWVRGILYAE